MSKFMCVRISAFCLGIVSLLAPLGCRSSPSDGSGGGEGQASAASLSGPPKFNVRFQTREPRECTPVRSVPSATVAAALLQCSEEGTSSQSITLFQDVHIEMGSPRAFMMSTDVDSNDIDPAAKVYPIRGSATSYICAQVDDVMKNKGKNCSVFPTTKMNGTCYKTKFNDWKCRMGGGDGQQQTGKPGPTAY